MHASTNQTPPPRANTDSRIAFLDYLRIFSFISVFIGQKFHTSLTEWLVQHNENVFTKATLKTILFLSEGGNVGVIVFFLISGYIITHVLQNEATCSFLIKRIFRIYPLYILAVTAHYITIDDTLPPLKVLLCQLTLTGDLIRAPYTLNGIEWTLRIEIYFYVFMAALNSLGITKQHNKLLPAVLYLSILACSLLAPLPSYEIWTKGYFTSYAPFLLTGSAAYLAQQMTLNKILFLLFPITTLGIHLWSLLAQHKTWDSIAFSVAAITLFMGALLVRKQLRANIFITRLADLTYAFYLFHHWLFDYAREVFIHLEINIFSEPVQQTVAVFIVAYLANQLVEKPFVQLGKTASNIACRKKSGKHPTNN